MRYKNEKYGSKINNLTKPLFDLLSLDLIQLIANFLPGVMMAKIVYENIKRISERLSKNNHGELSRQGVLINGGNELYLNKTERNKYNNDDSQDNNSNRHYAVVRDDYKNMLFITEHRIEGLQT